MFKFVNEPELSEYIGFRVANDWYCTNINNVQEIILIPAISKVPNVEEYIEGAINLRGKIIQIINMRKWFRLPWGPYTKESRIMVLNMNEQIIGILVDQVDEVFRIDDYVQFSLPQIIGKKMNKKYINSVIFQENRILLDITPEKIHIKEV